MGQGKPMLTSAAVVAPESPGHLLNLPSSPYGAVVNDWEVCTVESLGEVDTRNCTVDGHLSGAAAHAATAISVSFGAAGSPPWSCSSVIARPAEHIDIDCARKGRKGGRTGDFHKL